MTGLLLHLQLTLLFADFPILSVVKNMHQGELSGRNSEQNLLEHSSKLNSTVDSFNLIHESNEFSVS